MTDSMDLSYQLSHQKIIFTGDPGVGKTSIINSIMGVKFNAEYEPSIGVDFFSKTIKYKEKLIKLQIWDSAGQEKFRSLIPNYIRGASLIFLVFDTTNKESFQSLNEWINFIKNIDDGKIIIVGNKIDLEDNRQVTKEEAEKYCEEKKIDYFEVSAKEGTNINNLLYTSVANLPIFNAINIEGISKEKIIEILYQENLDSNYHDNTTSEPSGNNPNNLNINKSHLEEITKNNEGINNNVLLNNQQKKRYICLC